MNPPILIVTPTGSFTACRALQMFEEASADASALMMIFDQLCARTAKHARKACKHMLKNAWKYTADVWSHIMNVIAGSKELAAERKAFMAAEATKFSLSLSQFKLMEIAKVTVTFSEGAIPNRRMFGSKSIFAFSHLDLDKIYEAMAKTSWKDLPRTFTATMLITNVGQISEYSQLLAGTVEMIESASIRAAKN